MGITVTTVMDMVTATAMATVMGSMDSPPEGSGGRYLNENNKSVNI